jgi:hypothetical protein
VLAAGEFGSDVDGFEFAVYFAFYDSFCSAELLFFGFGGVSFLFLFEVGVVEFVVDCFGGVLSGCAG